MHASTSAFGGKGSGNGLIIDFDDFFGRETEVNLILRTLDISSD